MFEDNCYKLICGNMLEKIEELDSNSVDSIVTDPPYELNFMGKCWDSAGVSFNKLTWEKCLRVLKPGGYLLAFGGSRTFHRIAAAIEDAGFEIRDTIMWIYGSGFPKSMNIGLALDKKEGVESEVVGQNKDILIKQKKDLESGHRKIVDSFNAGAGERNNGFVNVSADIKVPVSDIGRLYKGWGTALKPSFEPIIVARKPLDGSCVDNVIKWGTGGINIDECRIKLQDFDEKDLRQIHRSAKLEEGVFNKDNCGLTVEADVQVLKEEGRFPANTILTYDDTDYEEVCGGFPDSGSGNGGNPYNYAGREYNNKETSIFNGDKPQAPSNYNDNGSASRYFYCAKASAKDRDEGLECLPSKAMYVADNTHGNLGAFYVKKAGGKIGDEQIRKNIHPTVKPTLLMQYLVRLVTPKGGVVFDPFMGSGSTGKAVMFENRERNANYKFIGMELDDDYIKIADSRISFALNGYVYNSNVSMQDNCSNLKSSSKKLITLW